MSLWILFCTFVALAKERPFSRPFPCWQIVAIYRRLRRRFLLLFFRLSWSAAAKLITDVQKARISPAIWSTKIKSFIKFKFIKFLICQQAAPVAAFFATKFQVSPCPLQLEHGETFTVEFSEGCEICRLIHDSVIHKV